MNYVSSSISCNNVNIRTDRILEKKRLRKFMTRISCIKLDTYRFHGNDIYSVPAQFELILNYSSYN